MVAKTDSTELTFEAAEIPTSPRAAAKPNPFIGQLEMSRNTESGRAVTVPAADVKEMTYLIRTAANKLNIGSRIVYTDGRTGKPLVTDNGKGGQRAQTVAEIGKHKGSVKILFAAKARKTRTVTDDSTDADAVDSAEDNATDETTDDTQ